MRCVEQVVRISGRRNTLDIVFNFFRMTSAVYEDVLNAGIGEELESIFDQRGICERKETLRG